MNILKPAIILLALLITCQLPAQEFFQNNIMSHKIEDGYLIKAIQELIAAESEADQDFGQGRGYILVKKKNLPSDSSWYYYELSVQYAAIDIENDVLFPEYFGYVDKRIVLFFLDDSAQFEYPDNDKQRFLQKLEPYLAPKVPVKKMVNGKMIKDKDYRPENKYKINPKVITLQYRHNDLPLILSEYDN